MTPGTDRLRNMREESGHVSVLACADGQITRKACVAYEVNAMVDMDGSGMCCSTRNISANGVYLFVPSDGAAPRSIRAAPSHAVQSRLASR